MFHRQVRMASHRELSHIHLQVFLKRILYTSRVLLGLKLKYEDQSDDDDFTISSWNLKNMQKNYLVTIRFQLLPRDYLDFRDQLAIIPYHRYHLQNQSDIECVKREMRQPNRAYITSLFIQTRVLY